MVQAVVYISLGSLISRSLRIGTLHDENHDDNTNHDQLQFASFLSSMIANGSFYCFVAVTVM